MCGAIAFMASCAEETFLSEQYSVEGQVEISAQVGYASSVSTRTNPQSTDSYEQSVFNINDVIAITNNEWETIYEYKLTADSVWQPTEISYSNMMKWGSEATCFEAYYPMTEGTSFTTFTLPTEQSEEENIVSADYMTASASYDSKPADCKADLTFERKTARAVINIASINGEAGDEDGYVSDLKIYSTHSAITNGAASGDAVGVSPYKTIDAGGKAGEQYMALLIPGGAAESHDFITLNINYGGQQKGLTLSGIPTMEAGYSYTYNINVEDPLSLTVEVEAWEGTTISSYKAAIKYVEYNFNTTDNVAGDFSTLLEQEIGTRKGVTLALYGDMTEEQYDTLRMFLAGTGSEAELILDLTNINSSPAATLATAYDASKTSSHFWMEEEDADIRDYTGLVSVIFPGGDSSSSAKNLTRSSDESGFIIGKYAFAGCSKLSTLINLEYAVEIEKEAFHLCQSLTEADMSSTTSIDTLGFYNNVALTTITAPNVETIGPWAFASCYSLQKADLPALKTLGEIAFFSCTSMTEANVPKLEEINVHTFDNCTLLKTVNAESAVRVDSMAFTDCEALNSLTLTSAEYMGPYALYGCSSLEELDLPNLVRADYMAFDLAYALKKLYLPKLEIASTAAFYKCYALEEAYMDILEVVGRQAFCYCLALDTVSLPMAKELVYGAFYICPKLRGINAPLVERIGDCCFYGHPSYGYPPLKRAYFPEADSLGYSVFYNCTSLVEAYLPKVTTMGKSNFRNCTSLKKATLGNLTEVPVGTFRDCTSLEELDMSNCTSVPTIYSDVLYNVPSTLVIYVANEELKEQFESTNYWNDFTIKVKGEDEEESEESEE